MKIGAFVPQGWRMDLNDLTPNEEWNTILTSAKKIEDYGWFCPPPFVNIYRGVTGHTTPCCAIKNWYIPLKKLKESTSVYEDYSLPLFESLRQQFLNGGGPLIDGCCTICKKNELAGKDSHRIKYMDRFINGDLNIYPLPHLRVINRKILWD